jgi:hypothetical protein
VIIYNTWAVREENTSLGLSDNTKEAVSIEKFSPSY